MRESECETVRVDLVILFVDEQLISNGSSALGARAAPHSKVNAVSDRLFSPFLSGRER